MYITADPYSRNRQVNKTAFLETNLIHSNETLCVEFFYFIYGEHGSLSLYENHAGNRKAALLWNSSKSTKRWRRVLAEVPPGSYKLSFIGKLYDKFAEKSIVAFDDLILENCVYFGKCIN